MTMAFLVESCRKIRRRTGLVVLLFLLFGFADVVLLLFWGLDSLWGFVIIPMILVISVLARIAFSTDFLVGRSD